MKLSALLALAVILVSTSQARAGVPTGPFSPVPGSEQAAFQAANATAIARLAETIRNRDASTSVRRNALEQMANSYPDAALNLAVELIAANDETITRDSVQLLADSVAMSDQRMVMDAMPEGAAMISQRIEAAKSALRSAVDHQRKAIREIVAGTLASLGDKATLDQIDSAVKSGAYSPVEAVNYFGLARPEVGARYIVPYLKVDSDDARIAAISYLGTIPQYQVRVRDAVLMNAGVAPGVRAKAAEVLGRYDDDFPSYALVVTIDRNVPPIVYGAVISGYIDSSERLKTLSTAKGKILKEAVTQALVTHPDDEQLLVLNRRLFRF